MRLYRRTPLLAGLGLGRGSGAWAPGAGELGLQAAWAQLRERQARGALREPEAGRSAAPAALALRKRGGHSAARSLLLQPAALAAPAGDLERWAPFFLLGRRRQSGGGRQAEVRLCIKHAPRAPPGGPGLQGARAHRSAR